MRIQLATGISVRNVQGGEITDTCDLYVVRGLNEMRASYGTIRDQTRPIARLDAPGDLDAFGYPDGRVCARLRRSKNTEVVDRVD